MRKFTRNQGSPIVVTLRKLIRKYGPPILLIGMVYLGIEAFHAFIDYLKRTWDIGALILAWACVISLFQGTWRITLGFLRDFGDRD
ncbi:hypothetical protein ACSYAD_32335 [Acaryochloris marina NIES-2412]|uniref:hypothetical protein n=1 Tax=Acaryochloris marina TaxID=155978 RepID=UPI00405882A7